MTVTAPGYTTYVRTFATVTIPKVKPTVKAKLTASTVTTSKHAKVIVTVKGQSGPTGRVTVTYGKKRVTVTMKRSADGRVVVALPLLKRGAYTVRVHYTPTSPSDRWLTTAGSSAVRLTVR